MSFHSESERVAAEIGYKRVLRSHYRSHVPYHLRAAFRGERNGQIGVYKPVIALVGYVEGGVSGIFLKREVPPSIIMPPSAAACPSIYFEMDIR